MGEITEFRGAGEGNRTLVISLEGFCSTIELHPPDSTFHPNLYLYFPPCISTHVSTRIQLGGRPELEGGGGGRTRPPRLPAARATPPLPTPRGTRPAAAASKRNPRRYRRADRRASWP